MQPKVLVSETSSWAIHQDDQKHFVHVPRLRNIMECQHNNSYKHCRRDPAEPTHGLGAQTRRVWALHKTQVSTIWDFSKFPPHDPE